MNGFPNGVLCRLPLRGTVALCGLPPGSECFRFCKFPVARDHDPHQLLKAGSQIQAAFTVLKLIPILFAILAGIFLFQGANMGAVHRIWSGIPSALPLLLYASMGFEAACLLSNKIKNPKKNAPRAILISYGITLTIAAIYQLCFYGSLGTLLTQFASHKTSYLYAFPTLLAKLLPNNPATAIKLKGILHLALASSALGGGYGIMFSNTWNLHTLAQNNHLFFKNIFT